MNKIALSLTFVSFTLLAGCSQLRTANIQDSTQQIAERSSYSNEVYGYSFTYPASLELLEYSDQAVAVGTLTNGGIDAVVEAQVMESGDGGSDLSFAEFVAARVLNMCAADGPGISVTCTEIERQEEFSTASGVTGQALYLVETTTNLNENTTSTETKGPFYTFDVSGNTPNTQAVLVIYTPIPASPDAADEQVVEDMALSVQLH